MKAGLFNDEYKFFDMSNIGASQQSRKETPGGSVSDHLANERTFLAWVRTSIGIMAFGFVVVKFTLFIKQISIVLQKPLARQLKDSSFVPSIFLTTLLTISIILVGIFLVIYLIHSIKD